MEIKLTQITQCPLCNSKDYEFLFETCDVQFSRTFMVFSLVKCLFCDLAYLKERPSSESISTFYPKGKYPTYSKTLLAKDENLLRRKLKTTVKERLKARKLSLLDRLLLTQVLSYWKVAALFPVKSKILDVGCGAGWRLDLYKEFGWETYGFDISSEAIEIAKSKGHDVVVAEMEIIPYPDNYFDVVQISHVIEHLPHPVFTIKKAFSLLKEGGVLLLETPNNSSLFAKVFKTDFWQIDSPRHFQIFNIKSLTFLLVDCGFIIDKLATNNSKKGIINSGQAFVTRKYKNNKNIKDNKLLKSISIFLSYLLIPLNKFGLGENIIVFAKKS